MSYKKVSFITLILTIACLPLSTFLYASVDMSSGYFYETSYEGFAGYCAIITPEITEASKKVTERLNIRSNKPIFTTHTSIAPQTWAAPSKPASSIDPNALSFADMSSLINENMAPN